MCTFAIKKKDHLQQRNLADSFVTPLVWRLQGALANCWHLAPQQLCEGGVPCEGGVVEGQQMRMGRDKGFCQSQAVNAEAGIRVSLLPVTDELHGKQQV